MGQKINIDLSDYDGVIVASTGSSSGTDKKVRNISIIPKNTTDFMSIGSVIQTTTGSLYGSGRKVNVEANGITIGDSFYSTNIDKINNVCIPYKIYGYKDIEIDLY